MLIFALINFLPLPPGGTTITAIDASTDPLNQVLTLSNALTTPMVLARTGSPKGIGGM